MRSLLSLTSVIAALAAPSAALADDLMCDGPSPPVECQQAPHGDSSSEAPVLLPTQSDDAPASEQAAADEPDLVARVTPIAKASARAFAASSRARKARKTRARTYLVTVTNRGADEAHKVRVCAIGRGKRQRRCWGYAVLGGDESKRRRVTLRGPVRATVTGSGVSTTAKGTS